MNDHPSDRKEIIARLRNTQLFRDLAPAVLRKMAEVSMPVHFSPGEIIVQEGEQGDALYILAYGLLRVTRKTDRGSMNLGMIHKGGFFGEFALMESVKRTATVKAVSPSMLFKISRSDLISFFKRNPAVEDEIMEVLDRRKAEGGEPIPPAISVIKEMIADFLHHPKKEIVELLSREVEWVWCPRGEYLLREKEEGDAFYIVIDGQLRVTKARNGEEAFIGLISDGQMIGEMTVFSGGTNTANVQAVGSSKLLKFRNPDIRELVDRHQVLKKEFRDLMERRVSQGERLIRKIAEDEQDEGSLTLAYCEEVLRTEDLISRNYKITDGYYRLALDLANVLGEKDVNWPAFGAHASNSAGFTIRKEELRGMQEGHWFLKFGGLKWAPEKLIRFMEDVVEWVSDSISDGNLRIFGDMAPVIVRFIEFMRTDDATDRSKMYDFLETLKPGKSEEDGQDLLGLALLAWYDASQEEDPKRKSELMLLGNARMGLHEQIRIQPDLEQALGAPLKNHVGDELSRSMRSYTKFFPPILQKRLNHTASRVEKSLKEQVSALVRKIITKEMMSLHIPGKKLMLGDDVPVLDDRNFYPDTLQYLEEPALTELFETYTKNRHSVEGSGAGDWVNLGDRMNFILHLFRSHQQNYLLYQDPLPEDR
ncbi:MAG: hypothetical protein CL666_07620 [Balneola sp.]|nr:hypothetical protein [Balneola sp.]